MERLILTYTIGDDYTYSAEQIVPLIYKSKEEAIEDLSLLLLDYIDREKDYKKQLEVYNDRYNKLSHNLTFTKNEKRKAEISQEWNIAYKEQNDFEKSFSRELSFGGTQLNYEDFLYTDSSGKKDIFQVNITTLDEFFAPNEKELNIQPNSVSKPKLR